MAKKKTTSRKKTTQPATNRATKKTTQPTLRDRILTHFNELGIRLSAEQFDEVLSEAEKNTGSHLEFLDRVLSPAAAERRQRSIERRIRQARFRDEAATLETFDWNFNPSIDRVQIEELATTDFVRRGDNLVLAGQSGLGKPQPSQYPFRHPGMCG